MKASNSEFIHSNLIHFLSYNTILSRGFKWIPFRILIIIYLASSQNRNSKINIIIPTQVFDKRSQAKQKPHSLKKSIHFENIRRAVASRVIYSERILLCVRLSHPANATKRRDGRNKFTIAPHIPYPGEKIFINFRHLTRCTGAWRAVDNDRDWGTNYTTERLCECS